MKITAKCNSYRTVLSSGQKGFKQWILNWFLLVNLEMLIRTAIQLLEDLGVCQKKTVGHLARDCYADGERKTQTRFGIQMSERSRAIQYSSPLKHFFIINHCLNKRKVFFFSVFQYKSHQHLNICSNSQRYYNKSTIKRWIFQYEFMYFSSNDCIIVWQQFSHLCL